MPSVSKRPCLLLCWTHTYVGDGVQGSVSADAEIRPRHIVGDGGRDHNHRDTELLVFLPGGQQFQQSQVGLLDKRVQLGDREGRGQRH